MGYITILGITFWIPDFNDLWNFVVRPLQDSISGAIGSITYPILQFLRTIAAQVYNLLKPLIDPIWNFLQGIAAKVLELIRPLISPILSFLQGIANQIWQFVKPTIDQLWSLIKPAIDNLWNFMKTIVSQISAAVKPWIDALGALFKGEIGPLATLLTGSVNKILELIAHAFPPLQLGILGIQVGIDALGAKIAGQPVEIDKIFAAHINQTLNPLAAIPADLWKQFNDIIAKPLGDLFAGAWSGLTAMFQGYGNWVMDSIHGIAAGGPEAAVANLSAVAFTLGPLITGINIAAQAIELIHPIKHMGIVQTVTSMLDSLGIRQFAFGAYALLVAGALDKPVRQGLAFRYRPEIPSLSMADTMYFQRQITIEAWQRIYGLHGWAEKYITAWYESFWEEPSDRMIVGMVEGGEVELEWLQEKLLRRRYRPEDAARIMRYATKKALGDEIKAIISELQADLGVGLLEISEVQAELQDVGVKGPELDFRVRAMTRRMARIDVKDKIDILTAQVKAGDLTIDRYRNELIALGLRTARVTKLVEKEELRQKPQVDKPKERKRELAQSFYVRLFIEGTIDEAKLRRYLGELTPPYKPEDLELIVTDAKIRRTKALAAAA